jgi:hypothetical protein
MTGYTLRFACPTSPADCLDEPLLSYLLSPPWVAYLTFGDLYLSDVNDDTDLENEYEAGLVLWAASVRILFEALCRWSGGISVWISLSRRAGLAGLADKLTGRAVESEWTVQSRPLITPDLVQSMTTYGWAAAMWTALPDGKAAALSRGSMRMPDLEQLVRGGDITWWLSHGYKEPFLTGHTPSLTMSAVADLVRKEVGIPVQFTEEPFVPHRVRLHRRWMA